MPTVSVLIPTYNRADRLPRAVDAALGQTLDDIEVFVVDDASDDETGAVVRSYDDPRLTLLEHETNRGASAARNTALAAATGEYVALLDDDDEWAPTKLERQVETLASRSDEWVAAYCKTTLVVDEEASDLWRTVTARLGRYESTEGAEGGAELLGDLFSHRFNTSAGSSLLVERDVAERIGGFDESFERYQDSEFLVRVLKEGKLAYVDEPLLRRYPSGGPSADAIRRANEHFLETFATDVVRLEMRGYPVTGANQFALAKAYLAEGRLGTGFDYLRVGETPSLRQLPGLAYSVYRGVISGFGFDV